jgi:uncharacterized membrane protein
MRPIKVQKKIRIKLTITDWIFEVVGFLFFILLLILPVIYISELPAKIPIEFNGSGNPDGYGNKTFIWIFPAVGGFLYVLLTVLSLFPHLYNFLVKITPDNILVQYKLATKFVRILKTVIVLLLLYVCYQTIRISTGETTGLGRIFLPVFLILIFGVILIYIIRSINNKQ